jgi:NitT/TauT family transport system substrate-binding protein
VIFAFYTSKGYRMSLNTFQQALSRVEVNPGFPGDLVPYMQQQAEILLQAKLIREIPDWSKVLRPEFMQKAQES